MNLLKNIRWKTAQSLELRWWKRYLKNKPVQNYLSWKKAYWRDFLETIKIAPPGGSRVLDAGCGPAGIFTVLEACQVVAIDPLLDAYDREIPHFHKDNYTNTHFIPTGLEEFEGADKPFDFVFCLNAINHVRDLNKALDNCAAATNTLGKLILSIDAHNFALLQFIFQRIPGDILHPHQYGLEDYCRLVEARGMTVDSRIRLKKGKIFDYWVLVASYPSTSA